MPTHRHELNPPNRQTTKKAWFSLKKPTINSNFSWSKRKKQVSDNRKWLTPFFLCCCLLDRRGHLFSTSFVVFHSVVRQIRIFCFFFTLKYSNYYLLAFWFFFISFLKENTFQSSSEVINCCVPFIGFKWLLPLPQKKAISTLPRNILFFHATKLISNSLPGNNSIGSRIWSSHHWKMESRYLSLSPIIVSVYFRDKES